MDSLSDNALMLKVKAGDSQKLGLLYERYKKWVFNFFYQMNGDQAMSEDLVQNVFIRILKYKHTYTPESKFVTWMFQIARNMHNDVYRKNAKKEEIALDAISYKMQAKDDVEEDIEDKESQQLLYKALDRLPYEKREILMLSKLKELKYKEIGELLGCSEVAARTKAHRALQDLRITFLAMEKH